MEENSMNLEEKINYISEQLDPFLKEGEIYYSSPIVTEFGTSGGSFYTLEDNKICYDFDNKDAIDNARRNLGYKQDLFSISREYSEHTKLQYRFEKGKLMTVKVYDIPMLLEDIQSKYLFDLEQCEAIKQEEEIIFTEKNEKIKTSIVEKTTFSDSVWEDVSDYCNQDIICLYKALEIKPKKLKFIFDGHKLLAQSNIAFPEYGIEKIEEIIDFSDFNSKEITSIFSYLESFDDAKIEKALSVLKENQVFKLKAEHRYLNFIKARLDNATASIFDFNQASPTKAEIDFFLSNNRWIKSKKTKKNPATVKLSFSYCNEEQSKLFVDFIGSISGKYAKVLKFSAEARMTSKESDLEKIIRENFKLFQLNLEKDLNEYKEGWYGEILNFLFKLPSISQVLFDKTSFLDANGSLYLKEFIFFLLLKSDDTGLYFDIHQSDAPELTYLFWMFKNVPETNWSDSEAYLPQKNRLKYKRTAYYKIGDFSKWQYLEK
ncbi:hypothetical protein [Aureivirga sp. CE67]|uniref:hypothetical protein n=1 Tax=Aureivirga sp. CE67 TaxID=1788983 RepID=UPI0018CA5B88|nr:hypothetical protein [Aureivirga sp. CE67]